jgi:hypothetical protein
MSACDLLAFAGLLELAGGVLPDDVEHAVAAVPVEGDKALIDQRADAIQRVSDIVNRPANSLYVA